MKLYFARHGESEANILGIISNRGSQYPLTERGREQARALADTLREVPLTHLYTSPLQRAVETVQIVAEVLGLPYQINDALREYDCGILEGQSDATSWVIHEQTWRAWLDDGDYDVCPEGGENFRDIQARFVPFIDALVEQHSGTSDEILLMGHGGTYRAMLPLVLANIDHAFTLSHPLGNASTIRAEWRNVQLVCSDWCGTPVA